MQSCRIICGAGYRLKARNWCACKRRSSDRRKPSKQSEIAASAFARLRRRQMPTSLMLRMNPEMEIGTDKKALQINLDTNRYGTFAEIGAGQEVARRFFHVGAAAGTIAKTMSAYDTTFSDAIYGPTDRYVSRVRLGTMLDREYKLLIERLDQTLGTQRLFFVFADTVAARSFKQHNEAHGWLGVRFQTDFRGEPSQIIIHVRMLDEGNVEQQEALGVIGVNLIYGAFYHTKPEELISSLQQNLAPG